MAGNCTDEVWETLMSQINGGPACVMGAYCRGCRKYIEYRRPEAESPCYNCGDRNPIENAAAFWALIALGDYSAAVVAGGLALW